MSMSCTSYDCITRPHHQAAPPCAGNAFVTLLEWLGFLLPLVVVMGCYHDGTAGRMQRWSLLRGHEYDADRCQRAALAAATALGFPQRRCKER